MCFTTSHNSRFLILIDVSLFVVLLFRRVLLPLPFCSRSGRCGRPLDPRVLHRSACATPGVWRLSPPGCREGGASPSRRPPMEGRRRCQSSSLSPLHQKYKQGNCESFHTKTSASVVFVNPGVSHPPTSTGGRRRLDQISSKQDRGDLPQVPETRRIRTRRRAIRALGASQGR